MPFEGLDAPWFDPPVDVIMQSWATHNRCSGDANVERISSEVLRYSWQDCAAPVEWYLVEGGGHSWPGAAESPYLGHTTREISASDLIWEFFFR